MMKIVAAMMMITGVTAAPMHADRIAEIAEIQEKTQLWVAGETRFSAFPPGFGTKWLNGVIGNVKVAVAVALAKGEIERFVPANPELDIPESFDVAENWPECAKIINDIRDQSNCGCCWAFGGAEAASDRMCIATNGAVQIPISAQDVCFNSNKNGCGGGQITTPWTYIKETGAVSGGQYNNSGPFGDVGLCADFSLPHCHHHGPQGNDPYPDEGDAGCPSQKSPEGPTECDSDSQSPHDDFQADKYSMDAIQVATGEEDIQRMIMEGGSVETAFTVYADFENYVSGIYEHVTGGPSGGHAVKFVGWGVDEATGTKYWKVANSWNPYWGESGYFRIVRGVNECGIEDEVTGASASASWTKADAKLN